MDTEKIESLLTGAGVTFEKKGFSIWELKPGDKRNLDATLVCVSGEHREDGDLLKIHASVGKLPDDASRDFLIDMFRKNRTMGHGGFALKSDDEVLFVDTLELEKCDQNEMDATLDWLMKASSIYEEKLDHSKMPYIDGYE